MRKSASGLMSAKATMKQQFLLGMRSVTVKVIPRPADDFGSRKVYLPPSLVGCVGSATFEECNLDSQSRGQQLRTLGCSIVLS